MGLHRTAGVALVALAVLPACRPADPDAAWLGEITALPNPAGAASRYPHLAATPAGPVVLACAVFRKLARSSDPDIRAGALLRLARSLRKAGKSEMALAVYDDLAALGNASVRGIPAELLARQALQSAWRDGPNAGIEPRSTFHLFRFAAWPLDAVAHRV